MLSILQTRTTFSGGPATEKKEIEIRGHGDYGDFDVKITDNLKV